MPPLHKGQGQLHKFKQLELSKASGIWTSSEALKPSQLNDELIQDLLNLPPASFVWWMLPDHPHFSPLFCFTMSNWAVDIGVSRQHFSGSENHLTATQKECATPPNVHPTSRHVTASDEFTWPSPTLVLQAIKWTALKCKTLGAMVVHTVHKGCRYQEYTTHMKNMN